jgi:uncharacterized membrane protein (DUF106 family)
MAGRDAPLPSRGTPGAPVSEETEESLLTEGAAEGPLAEVAPVDPPEDEPTPSVVPAAAPARPKSTFKVSTFIIVFLGLLGLLMLIEPNTRESIAIGLGVSPTQGGPFYTLFGFSSQHLLATMAIAGALEMLVTALAYNYTTDWVKQAKVARWSGAFRKVQMEAIRSGKKDRIEALKPFQERLTRLSSEVTIAQFKGMAITYFMLILMYTWVGTTIQAATYAQQTINLGSGSLHLMAPVLSGLPIPWWFLIFSLYTVPFSLAFRRALKHYWVLRFATKNQIQPKAPAPPAAAGNPA